MEPGGEADDNPLAGVEEEPAPDYEITAPPVRYAPTVPEPTPAYQAPQISVSVPTYYTPPQGDFARAVKWGCGVYVGLTIAGLLVSGTIIALCCGGFLGIGTVGKVANDALTTQRR